MRILFLHQNFPGQFGRLAAHLAQDTDNQVVTLGEQKGGKRFRVAGVHDYWYAAPDKASDATHHYLRRLEGEVRRGQGAYRAMRELKKKGFDPDVVYAHPGWGEALFAKDIFPKAKLICFWEWYYNAFDGGHGYDPEFPAALDSVLRTRITNATHLLTYPAADWGITPTQWQRNRFPEFMHRNMSVIHDGIDTTLVKPDPDVVFQVSGTDIAVTRKDEVLTYVSRNLEPYRGFHTFMRALPEILESRPNCRVLIAGENGVSYGAKLPKGQTYKQKYLDETGLKSDRVHFLGRLPYMDYLKMLQVSTVHTYLTYPFVLSWSSMEAMAAGCLMVGSDTPPVREVLEDEKNGRLVRKPLDPKAVAERIVDTLAEAPELKHLRDNARRSMVENYDFKTVCLPKQLEMIRNQLG